jgi:hypothetical protein
VPYLLQCEGPRLQRAGSPRLLVCNRLHTMCLSERRLHGGIRFPVAIDRCKDGIWRRGRRGQRQACAKGSASSGHASGLDEEVASRRLSLDCRRGGVLCTLSAWVMGFSVLRGSG